MIITHECALRAGLKAKAAARSKKALADSMFLPEDISNVVRKSDILQGCRVFFHDFGSLASRGRTQAEAKKRAHRLVAAHGGGKV